MQNAWYPALLVEQLEQKSPYGIQVLGSAPLSVGRVVDGTLECKYHGWQFGKNGTCEHIPSAPDQKLSSSYDAKSFPVKEIFDAIWVWIGEETSEEEMEQKFPYSVFSLYDNPDWAYNTGERDLAIDHGLMVENLLDPAHLPFTHEGTLAKRSDAQKMTMKTVWNTATLNTEPKEEDEQYECSKRMNSVGFKVEAFRPNSTTKPVELGGFTFIAPCLTLLHIMINPKKNSQLIQVNWSVPVTPTKMRFLYWFFRNVGVSANKLPGVNRAFRWSSDKIIDQDVEMLGGQQVRLNQGANPWNAAVSADTGGVIYRKWRKKEELKGPWFLSANKARSSNGVVDIEELHEGCSRFVEIPTGEFKVRSRLSLFSPGVQKCFIITAVLFTLIIFVLFTVGPSMPFQ